MPRPKSAVATVDPDLTARLRAWTYRRQGLADRATSPAETLRRLVAVYSTHPTGPLSLLSRSAAMTPATIRAWEERREAVRIPAMRGSIFLAPIEHAAPLLAATRRTPTALQSSLTYAGIDPQTYAQLKARLQHDLREPVKVDDLKRANPDAERIITAVRVMAHEGLMLRVGSSLRRDDLSYVATDAWLGAPLAEIDPEAALRWLANAYLQAFGPATAADFAWWSGCTLRRARAALAGCETVEIGNGYLLPPDLATDFATVAPLPDNCWTALPKWDAYTMGHAPNSRQRWIDDAHLIRAFSLLGKAVTSGDSLPLVLHRGRAVASWSHRFDRDTMLVTIKPFAPDFVPPPGLFHEIAALFGIDDVRVTIEPYV